MAGVAPDGLPPPVVLFENTGSVAFPRSGSFSENRREAISPFNLILCVPVVAQNAGMEEASVIVFGFGWDVAEERWVFESELRSRSSARHSARVPLWSLPTHSHLSATAHLRPSLECWLEA